MINHRRALHEGVNHKVDRELLSLHRVSCYERFGGREWMRLLIAFGRFDDEIMTAANAAHLERYARHKQSKGETWVTEEDLAQKSITAAQ